MQNLLYRTGTTDLSNDELILLDVLFDGGSQFRSLPREYFLDMWNRHSHNLDDAELHLTLRRFCDRSILATEIKEGATYFCMTKHGGDLWSRERCPVWKRYVIERYGETRSGKPFVTIVATSAATRDDFLRLGGPSGMCRLDDARVRRFEIQRHILIPWRSFPRLYVAVTVGVVDEDAIDPMAYKQNLMVHKERRTWWRDVRELQKFVPLTK